MKNFWKNYTPSFLNTNKLPFWVINPKKGVFRFTITHAKTRWLSNFTKWNTQNNNRFHQTAFWCVWGHYSHLLPLLTAGEHDDEGQNRPFHFFWYLRTARISDLCPHCVKMGCCVGPKCVWLDWLMDLEVDKHNRIKGLDLLENFKV